MFFARQWFPRWSQIGITPQFLEFEQALRHHEYNRAYDIIGSDLSYMRSQPEQDTTKRYIIRQLHRLLSLSTRRDNTDLLKVWFWGFWPSFDVNDNEILNFAKLYFQVNIIVSPEEPDILFCSCFEDPLLLPSLDSSTRILFLGENILPNYYYFDYVLSMTPESHFGRNTYLPLWYLRSTRFAAGQVTYNPIDIDLALHDMHVNAVDDKHKICHIANNMPPDRQILLSRLHELGLTVDSYGSDIRPVDDKCSLLSRFNINLCLENSISYGYVTEKLFDSFSRGAYQSIIVLHYMRQ